MSADRPLPQSQEAEMALLGSMLLEPEVVDDALALDISDSDFSSESHATIFRALVKCWEKHRQIDLVILVDMLRSSGDLDKVGGDAYLLQLAEGVPSAAIAPYYAKVVREQSKRRRAIVACETALYELRSTEDLDGSLDTLETKVLGIRETTYSEQSRKVGDILNARIARYGAGKGANTGLLTGYYDLDKILCGFQPGDMIVIGARPSVGKTGLMMNLAEQVCRGGLQNGQICPYESLHGVLVFSLEMGADRVTDRLVAAYAGCNAQRMNEGTSTAEELRRISDAQPHIDAMPLHIVDRADLTLGQIRAIARRKVHRIGVKCVFIDYLGLIKSNSLSRNENRENQVSALSRGIKSLARELKVPIVLLCQLNRDLVKRGESSSRPRMSDLRESGAIEQDADVVMLLHREEYGKDERWAMENPDLVGLTELIVAKHRNGPVGSVWLQWNPEITRFMSRSPGRPGFAKADKSMDPNGLEVSGWQ